MNDLNYLFIFIFILLLKNSIELYLQYRNRKSIINNISKVPEEFSDSITLDEHQKAAKYQLANLYFGIVLRFYSLALLLGWTLFGLLSDLSESIFNLTDSEYINSAIFIFFFVLISQFLSLFPSIVSTFYIEDKYGFNNTTVQTFILDKIKNFILSLTISLPMYLLVIFFINTFINNWWLMSFISFTIFQFLILLIYPTVIAPLFNKFEKLDDPEYESVINELLNKTDFKSDGLFVMDGSTRSNHGNAYFTGLGSRRRIVFYDTLLKTLNPGEVEAVLAHELGHYKKKHIQWSMFTMSIVSLLSFYILFLLFNNDNFFILHGLSFISTTSKLFLFLLIADVYTFFTTPVSSFFSRKREFESDNYSIEYSDGKNMISALIKLIKDNASTLTPDHLYSKYYYSHPPAKERIENIKKRLN